jgi:3',5'-cyclic-AMP phosphodiesterase
MRSRMTAGWAVLLAITIGWAGAWSTDGPAAEVAAPSTHHILLLADPHLPGKHLAAKQRLRKTLNGWTDVEQVVVLGDLCEDRGTAEEVAVAKQFFAGLRHPTRFLVGNHDYFYEDALSAEGRRVRGSPASRAAKLARFKEAFGLSEVYASRRLGPYLLLFLSTDDLDSPNLAQISDRQLTWLRDRLREQPTAPTAIFFHAPLRGTLLNYNERVDRDGFVAQPAAELRALLLANRQVFLWVAGHMHVAATNESFRAPVNVFENQVTAVHVTDLERKHLWTTSLFFHPDRVVVKTFDHQAGGWMEELERTVPLPRR